MELYEVINLVPYVGITQLVGDSMERHTTRLCGEIGKRSSFKNCNPNGLWVRLPPKVQKDFLVCPSLKQDGGKLKQFSPNLFSVFLVSLWKNQGSGFMSPTGERNLDCHSTKTRIRIPLGPRYSFLIFCLKLFMVAGSARVDI